MACLSAFVDGGGSFVCFNFKLILNLVDFFFLLSWLPELGEMHQWVFPLPSKGQSSLCHSPCVLGPLQSYTGICGGMDNSPWDEMNIPCAGGIQKIYVLCKHILCAVSGEAPQVADMHVCTLAPMHGNLRWPEKMAAGLFSLNVIILLFTLW